MDFRFTLRSERFCLSPGDFLLIISTPSMKAAKQIFPTDPKSSGFLAKLFSSVLQTAMSAAINFYCKGYFGSEGKKVQVKGSSVHKSQNKEFTEFFYAIASNKNLLHQTFTSEFEHFLLEWRRKDLGLVKEFALDQHGILLTDSGFSLGAQTAIIDLKDAEIIASYAAAVCKQVDWAK